MDIKGRGRRMEDRSRGHVHKLNSICYLRSYYFLVTVTLSTRWARGGGGNKKTAVKRVLQNGYSRSHRKAYKRCIVDNEDSRGLERTNLMDTGHC